MSSAFTFMQSPVGTLTLVARGECMRVNALDISVNLPVCDGRTVRIHSPVRIRFLAQVMAQPAIRRASLRLTLGISSAGMREVADRL